MGTPMGIPMGIPMGMSMGTPMGIPWYTYVYTYGYTHGYIHGYTYGYTHGSDSPWGILHVGSAVADPARGIPHGWSPKAGEDGDNRPVASRCYSGYPGVPRLQRPALGGH